MLAGSALEVAAKLASWLALVSVGGLSIAGLRIPSAVQLACAAVAGPIAIAAGIRTFAAIWRGPPVIAFERCHATACKPEDAEAIREAAQLRGTMGGAGHVSPRRLAFAVIAWLGALASGAELVSERALELAGGWPFALAVVAVFAAVMFPSRPYWYREITGGGVVVIPPVAAALIVSRRLQQPAAREASAPTVNEIRPQAAVADAPRSGKARVGTSPSKRSAREDAGTPA